MVANNYVYYTEHFLYFLLIIQKITLIVVLDFVAQCKNVPRRKNEESLSPSVTIDW